MITPTKVHLANLALETMGTVMTGWGAPEPDTMEHPKARALARGIALPQPGTLVTMSAAALLTGEASTALTPTLTMLYYHAGVLPENVVAASRGQLAANNMKPGVIMSIHSLFALLAGYGLRLLTSSSSAVSVAAASTPALAFHGLNLLLEAIGAAVLGFKLDKEAFPLDPERMRLTTHFATLGSGTAAAISAAALGTGEAGALSPVVALTFFHGAMLGQNLRFATSGDVNGDTKKNHFDMDPRPAAWLHGVMALAGVALLARRYANAPAMGYGGGS